MGEHGVAPPAPYRIIAGLIDTLLDHGHSENDRKKFISGNADRLSEAV